MNFKKEISSFFWTKLMFSACTVQTQCVWKDTSLNYSLVGIPTVCALEKSKSCQTFKYYNHFKMIVT